MSFSENIRPLSALGNHLKAMGDKDKEVLITQAYQKNKWFTEENILKSLEYWTEMLTYENLETWVEPYNYPRNERKIGMVMAGNIPLVGFHDLLSTLICGHSAIIKLSAKDEVLLKYIYTELIEIAPEYQNKIVFKERLDDFDAIIATGGNNTARYFEYYFRNHPHIIRKNRNSIAILDGKETEGELLRLSEDIFSYFGLGCRNVTKLYLPENYNFDSILKSFMHWKDLINHNKYGNNYDYQKCIHLMNLIPIIDAGNLLLEMDKNISSPIAVMHYQYYREMNDVMDDINLHKEKIQCIISHVDGKHIPFGNSQSPQLWDYADDVDTMKFLTSLG